MRLVSPWRDDLDLETQVVATSLWAMGIPIGLAHVDAIAAGHHDLLSTFLVDEIHTDLVQPPSGPRQPATLDDAVSQPIRRGAMWSMGPRTEARDLLVEAAIARAGRTPMKSIELSAPCHDAGLSEVAAQYAFQGPDRLLDEVANEAARRVLRRLERGTAPRPDDGASRIDLLVDTLVINREAVALQRLLTLLLPATEGAAFQPPNRARTQARFVESVTTWLAPAAEGEVREATIALVRALVYVTRGLANDTIHAGATETEVQRLRVVIARTLRPALRKAIAEANAAA